MSIKTIFEKIQPLNGYVSIAPGAQYVFEKKLEPYMSVDLGKSFFNVVDTGNIRLNSNVTPALANFVGTDTTILSNISLHTPIRRADNYINNLWGSARMYFNGTLIESLDTNVGEIDIVKKRLTSSIENNTIYPSYQNVNTSFQEKYMLQNVNKLEHEAFPNYSKFFDSAEPFLGGGTLRIELNAHPLWFYRAIVTGPAKPYSANTGADDSLSFPLDSITKAWLSLNSLDLMLCVHHNKYFSPVNEIKTYINDQWKMERLTLADATSHYLQINVPKDLKGFGFVFVNSNVGNNHKQQIVDFTGRALSRYSNRLTTAGNDVTDAVRWSSASNQSLQLKNYQLQYGKNTLPYDVVSQALSADENSTDLQTYLRYVIANQNNDEVGAESMLAQQQKYGAIYYNEFSSRDSDQDFVKLRLEWNSATSSLLLYYFYVRDSYTKISYDITGHAVQVLAEP